MSIEGQVAGIVDGSTLLINRGERHGVRPGMRFAVFAEVEEVRDPASGESLGRWELVKGTVLAVHVQPQLTVCGPVPEEVPAGGESRTLSAEMAAASMPGRGPGALQVDQSQMSGRPAAGPIRVGDRVRSAD